MLTEIEQKVQDMIDSALEHASHGWHQLEVDRYVPPTDAWPPPTIDTIMGSGPYHIAAAIGYIKRAYDVLVDAEEPGDEQH